MKERERQGNGKHGGSRVSSGPGALEFMSTPVVTRFIRNEKNHARYFISFYEGRLLVYRLASLTQRGVPYREDETLLN